MLGIQERRRRVTLCAPTGSGQQADHMHVRRLNDACECIQIHPLLLLIHHDLEHLIQADDLTLNGSNDFCDHLFEIHGLCVGTSPVQRLDRTQTGWSEHATDRPVQCDR